MITCYVRYVLNPEKVAEFEQYARIWVSLIEKLSGTHHGYFLPVETPPGAKFSFPEIASEGPANIAVALFSFPGIEEYEKYRSMAGQEPDCRRATAIRQESKCFTSYERNFMRVISND
jgi:hypothetical protein